MVLFIIVFVMLATNRRPSNGCCLLVVISFPFNGRSKTISLCINKKYKPLDLRPFGCRGSRGVGIVSVSPSLVNGVAALIRALSQRYNDDFVCEGVQLLVRIMGRIVPL